MTEDFLTMVKLMEFETDVQVVLPQAFLRKCCIVSAAICDKKLTDIEACKLQVLCGDVPEKGIEPFMRGKTQ